MKWAGKVCVVLSITSSLHLTQMIAMVAKERKMLCAAMAPFLRTDCVVRTNGL